MPAPSTMPPASPSPATFLAASWGVAPPTRATNPPAKPPAMLAEATPTIAPDRPSPRWVPRLLGPGPAIKGTVMPMRGAGGALSVGRSGTSLVPRGATVSPPTTRGT